uniref:C-type lectin domain-containing protein n=1 Tax=Caenorhabditis japonica TaxID=281687 RepID=A0A8R1DLY8_CAEJA
MEPELHRRTLRTTFNNIKNTADALSFSQIRAQPFDSIVLPAITCLTFFRTATDFKSAEEICATLNGHLASIHNAIDNTIVSSQAQKYFSGSAWLGAKTTAPDVTNPLNWYWTDGSNFDYQNYRVGEPRAQGSTACMQLQTETAKWLTANCSSQLPFVCSTSSSVAPTCPTVQIPSHCPSGYTWFDETDFCYKSTVRFTNFNDARSACQADGGDLASIHSLSENAFLVRKCGEKI